MLLAFIASILLAEPAAEWPGFRGDGTSLASVHELPLKWDGNNGVAWQTELTGYGQSSPVVWGDRIFVTSISGESKERCLVACYGLKDGKRLWQKDSAASIQVKDSDYVSRAAPTPIVDAERVYAFFESGDLLAFDHAGTELWHRNLAGEYGEYKGNHGLGGSLAQTSDALFAVVDHDGPSYLLAVAKKTGVNRWKVERPSNISWSSPIVALANTGDPKDAEVIVSSKGSVEAYSFVDGTTRWSLLGLKGNTTASPTVTEKHIIVGSSDVGQSVAVRRGGKGNLADSEVAWRLQDAAASFSSPLAYQGRAYFVNKSGVATCVEEATGKPLWTHRIGSCWASPIGAAGRIYFFGKEGVTTVVAAAPEFESLAENALTIEGRLYGAAAVPGAFVLRTGRKLICVGKP
ncbi:MAG: PQQ-binding-like beta-propeller repeat protein [Planctomycetia bacterium]|nr:PQQ-binding-like beta-propeller repeat protein [Planctomycetia bacterium]